MADTNQRHKTKRRGSRKQSKATVTDEETFSRPIRTQQQRSQTALVSRVEERNEGGTVEQDFDTHVRRRFTEPVAVFQDPGVYNVEARHAQRQVASRVRQEEREVYINGERVPTEEDLRIMKEYLALHQQISSYNQAIKQAPTNKGHTYGKTTAEGDSIVFRGNAYYGDHPASLLFQRTHEYGELVTKDRARARDGDYAMRSDMDFPDRPGDRRHQGDWGNERNWSGN